MVKICLLYNLADLFLIMFPGESLPHGYRNIHNSIVYNRSWYPFLKGPDHKYCRLVDQMVFVAVIQFHSATVVLKQPYVIKKKMNGPGSVPVKLHFQKQSAGSPTGCSLLISIS